MDGKGNIHFNAAVIKSSCITRILNLSGFKTISKILTEIKDANTKIYYLSTAELKGANTIS